MELEARRRRDIQNQIAVMDEEYEDDGWGRHRPTGDDDVNTKIRLESETKLQMFVNSISQNEQTDEPMENPQEVITECLSKFCTPDYIMEPGIFTQLKRLAAASHCIPFEIDQ